MLGTLLHIPQLLLIQSLVWCHVQQEQAFCVATTLGGQCYQTVAKSSCKWGVKAGQADLDAHACNPKVGVG